MLPRLCGGKELFATLHFDMVRFSKHKKGREVPQFDLARAVLSGLVRLRARLLSVTAGGVNSLFEKFTKYTA